MPPVASWTAQIMTNTKKLQAPVTLGDKREE